MKITLTGLPDLSQRKSLSTKAFRLNFHSSLREANFWSQVLCNTSHAVSVFLGDYITQLSVTSKLVSLHKDALTIDKSPFSPVGFFPPIEFHWTRITFFPLKWDFKFHTYLSRNTQSRIGNFCHKFFSWSLWKANPMGPSADLFRGKSSKHSFSSPSHNKDPESPSHPTHPFWGFRGTSWPRGRRGRSKVPSGQGRKSPRLALGGDRGCSPARECYRAPFYHLYRQRESVLHKGPHWPSSVLHSDLGSNISIR